MENLVTTEHAAPATPVDFGALACDVQACQRRIRSLAAAIDASLDDLSGPGLNEMHLRAAGRIDDYLRLIDSQAEEANAIGERIEVAELAVRHA